MTKGPEYAPGRLIGYRCTKEPEAGVIPLSAYSDPCPFDVPVYEEADDDD